MRFDCSWKLNTAGCSIARWSLFAVCLLVPADTERHVVRAADGQLELTVVDRRTGEPIACRMHLKNAAARPHRPKRTPFWHDHFVFPGRITLKLPVGNYTFELERGPEYLVRGGYFTIENFADDSKQLDMKRFVDMSAHGWWSGDLHVRRPIADIELLMKADDLHVAQLLTWQNDRNDWANRPPAKNPLVRFDGDRYYHVMAGAEARSGTELLYLNLPAPLEVHRVNTEYPPLMKSVLEARKHPDCWIDLTKPYWWDLPMLVAHGQIDSIQLAHSHICRSKTISDEGAGRPRDSRLYPAPLGNARWSQEIYFRLLDCGVRIPPAAGSGSGITPNPLGYNRLYVHVDGRFDYQKWWQNLKAGRVVVTNGPLLRPRVNGELPGHVFRAEEGKQLDFEIGLTLSTRRPISYLELVKNGKVERSIRFEEYAGSGRLPKLHFARSGWFLIRAVTDLPKTYRFAMTGPYYVEIGAQRRISKQDALFFLEWVYQRASQIKLADAKQRREVLELHRKARSFWEQKLRSANAE